MIAVLLWLAALRGDLEMLKDTCDSSDGSIFISPGVEEANPPDVLEHWTLREYVELALLRAATGTPESAIRAVVVGGARIHGSPRLCIRSHEGLNLSWMACES